MSHADDLAALAAKYVNTTDRHIFLTGRAGTGKTTFLRKIMDQTFKNAIVAAPTGIAAINAGGVTLHSLLQLPFGVFIPENVPLSSLNSNINTPGTLFRNFRINSSKRQLIQQLELLIIDEVSMLRADLLDCIDTMLRHLRRNREVPFGGLQILFIGDLLQLPPVVKDEDKMLLNKYYDSPYFFDAHALKDNQPLKVELQKVYRQSDDKFISLLNRFRNNTHTDDDIEYLNSFFREGAEEDTQKGYIHLTTHNYKADQINLTKLQQIEGKSYQYNATVSGDFKEHLYPTNQTLELKKGAQVMFIKNDPTGEGRFFNGKIGQVSYLDSSDIYVQFEDGSKVKVEQYVWENKRYSLNKDSNEVEEKFLGRFEQYPIKLAWAVTIHKSQGLTFEKAILDLSGTFAAGQLYVALSRLTSLDGLILSSRIPQDPPGIDRVLKNFSTRQNSEKQLSEMLVHDRKRYIISFAEKVFNLDHILKNLHYHRKSFNKDENRSIKQQYLPWTNELIESTQSLHDVGLKFINQVKEIIDQDEYAIPLNERMEKAWKYFEKEFNGLVERISEHHSQQKKEQRVSQYVKELKELETLYHLQVRQMFKLHLFIQYAAKNTVLSREDLHQSELSRTLRPPKKKTAKKEKTPTSEISFNLFKEGKSIEEIAKERGFVKSTIEGHLCNYVESGEIDVLKLLEKKKLDRILKRYAKGIEGLGELKHDLGEDISYGEIKLALAYDKYQKEGEERRE